MRSNPSQTIMLLLLASSFGITGCISDGQDGDKGIVRFSQILRFADTDDFMAPVGIGYTLLVALQETERSSIIRDGATRVDLNLEVVNENGKPVDTVFPMGFAQYGMIFERPGSYRLHAVLDGEIVDSLTLRAAHPAGIRFSDSVSVSTQGDSCSQIVAYDDGIENETLHSNQSFQLHVVPYDDEGAPMLGLLPLTASHDGPLSLDAPLIGHGQIANSIVIEANGELGNEEMVLVTDGVTEDALELVLDTRASPLPIECGD